VLLNAGFVDHRIAVRWSARRNGPKCLTTNDLNGINGDDTYAYDPRTLFS
jgi:hypothetical protein